jgi:hypothetical protein
MEIAAQRRDQSSVRANQMVRDGRISLGVPSQRPLAEQLVSQTWKDRLLRNESSGGKAFKLRWWQTRRLATARFKLQSC